MSAAPEVKSVLGWVEIRPDEELVILVVVELPEWLRQTLSTDPPMAPDLGARWFAATDEASAGLALAVAEIRGETPRSCVWFLPNPPLSCVDAAGTSPHVVALVPQDDPGVVDREGRPSIDAGVLPRATYVDCTHESDSVRQLHGALLTQSDVVDAVDVLDPGALSAQIKPLRSRIALADGELLDDEQLLPMAWRPWHYELVKSRTGLLWVWPTQQIYFGLAHPSQAFTQDITRPTDEVELRLRGYLSTVSRLSRTMAVNQGGTIRLKWSRESGVAAPEVEGPHEDALDAVLPHLRKLLDPNEESGFSFSRTLKALSEAAYQCGATALTDELKRWREAEKGIRRKHVRELQHELAVELGAEPGGEPIRGPLPGAPTITPEALIKVYMYGEVLHVKEGLDQVAEWDSDPVLGPFMRQEVRADASALLHFYGAFATYVVRWLEGSQAGGSNAE